MIRISSLRTRIGAVVVALCAVTPFSLFASMSAAHAFPQYSFPLETIVNRTGAWWRVSPESWKPSSTPLLGGTTKVVSTNYWDLTPECAGSIVACPGTDYRRFGMIGSYGAMVWDERTNIYAQLVGWSDQPTDIAISGHRTAVITRSGAWFRPRDADRWSLLVAASDHPRRVAMSGNQIAVVTDSGAWYRNSDSSGWIQMATHASNPVEVALDGPRQAVIEGTMLVYRSDPYQLFQPLTTATSKVSLGMGRTAIITSSGAYDRDNDAASWHWLAGPNDGTTDLNVANCGRSESDSFTNCY